MKFYDIPATPNIAEIEKAIATTVESAIKNALDSFTVRIIDELDEIKSLMITDPDGLAREILGPHDDPSKDGGEIKTEQLVEMFQSAIKSLNKKKE